MSAEYVYDGSALGNVVRLKGIDGLTSRAHYLDAGAGGVEIDDLAGALNIVGLKDFAFNETTCTAAPRQWTGFVWVRNISGADLFEAPGVGRVWDVDLLDEQAILQFEAIEGEDGKRPAETDFARMAWLLAGPLAGLVFDNGLVNLTDNPRNLDPADFRDKYPNEVLADMAPQCGKDAWCYWDQDAEQISLFYDAPTATVYSSTLRLSNDPADADSVTRYAKAGMAVGRTPEDVYSRLVYKFVGGRIVRSRPATATAFRPRTLVTESTRVGNPATAELQAAAILEDHSHEDDTITCEVELSNEEVGLIQKGHRIQIKFTHLPGYEDFVWTRIRGRTLRQTDSKDRYVLALEMSTYLPPYAGGGDTGELPHSSACEGPPAFVQSINDTDGDFDLATTPTPGNVLIAAMAERVSGGLVDVPGFTLVKRAVDNLGFPRAASMWKRVVGIGDSTHWPWTGVGIGCLMEWHASDVDAFVFADDQNNASMQCGGSITPPAGSAVAIVGVGGVGEFDPVTYFITPDAGVTELLDDHNGLVGSPYAWVGYRTANPASGAYSVGGAITESTATGRNQYCGVTVSLVCQASDNPPQQGQWVFSEVVAMTGDAGTTAFPYTPGSLHVYVDGIPISPASFTETDPTTGAFALAWDPDDDEVVRVDYQGL